MREDALNPFLPWLPALVLAACASAPPDPAYRQSVEEWRARAERNLRADNGWLTLAGRFPMKFGVNTFGTGEANDLVFPKGLGPERMGAIEVAPGKVTLRMAPGLLAEKEGVSFDEYVMGTSLEKRDWVRIGRLAMHVIERDGRYILRLADNQSEVRKSFGGRVWYEVAEPWRVPARFVPHPPGHKVPIVNVLDEVSDEPSPGYVEFTIDGRTQRLDAVGDGEGLFFVFRDATAGRGTYRPGRFLYVEKKPAPGETFLLDLNRAYNPPCAFSDFTTCPLPPEQNILAVPVEAGEKYPPRRSS